MTSATAAESSDNQSRSVTITPRPYVGIPCVEEVSGGRNKTVKKEGHAIGQYLICFPATRWAGGYLLAGGLEAWIAAITGDGSGWESSPAPGWAETMRQRI